MRTTRLLRIALVTLLVAVARPASAWVETSLLAPDGTLYVVRAGTAKDLGIAGNYARPEDNVISWESLAQDGGRRSGLIPGASGSTLKSNLDLAYDEQSASLILLWKEEVSLLNVLHLGILRGNQWTVSDLLPNLGFPRAYNPRMLLSHPSVHTLDSDGKDVWSTRSLLSVIWWEDSNVSQARYAPIFLDEDSSAGNVQVYDLPATVGSIASSAAPTVPSSAYRYPSLQLEGPGGGILASFADLQTGFENIIRIGFPTDLGTPGPANPTWLRRRVPIVGIVGRAPVVTSGPPDGVDLSTYIGSSYNPTVAWHDDKAVRYVRFDGKKWSDVNSITLSDAMSLERATRLVQDMATKN